MVIIVFSQNIVLSSLIKKFQSYSNEDVLFLSTHKLFDNEKKTILDTFSKAFFSTYADYMTDTEGEMIDHISNDGMVDTLDGYIEKVKHNKNILIINKINEQYSDYKGFVCCDDLGIDVDAWKASGYEFVECEYYYVPEENSSLKENLLKIKIIYDLNKLLTPIKLYYRVKEYVFKGEYNNKEYVFIGNLNRIGYRININWKQSNAEAKKLIKRRVSTNKTYLTTIHELPKAIIAGINDARNIDFRVIQDGYLAPNDPCEYLFFYPIGSKYYAWDTLGMKVFQNFKLPVNIMPFRKKIYLPHIKVNKRIKKILIATSGPGDWTAIKNRSDEDLVVEAFVKIAKEMPEISFVIRCHPTWIRPGCNGVNSINRCTYYIEKEKVSNISISSNIPKDEGENCFVRSSLEEDLKNTDFVFGEHSIAMIDAVMQGIPFASVNLTNRRNLFVGITDLGFPHCKTVDDIKYIIASYGSLEFQNSFNVAVDNYNHMTDQE